LLAPLSPPPPTSTLFPYTTLFRSRADAQRSRRPRRGLRRAPAAGHRRHGSAQGGSRPRAARGCGRLTALPGRALARLEAEILLRSEEHTSELQSQSNLVCRLLLEK